MYRNAGASDNPVHRAAGVGVPGGGAGDQQAAVGVPVRYRLHPHRPARVRALRQVVLLPALHG